MIDERRDVAAAIAYLDAHTNLEAMIAGVRENAPTLERITEIVGILGEPQRQYPVVHVTGTNGKTSTARAVSALLAAHDLSVGAYTSPHLSSITERMSWNGAAIPPDAFARVIAELHAIEPLLTGKPTWFELVTAAGFAWFADLAVDVAVVEVGLGGTWDATNVADGVVAVITTVGLDHQEFLGDTVEEIATEKAGIIKADAAVVVGDVGEGARGVIDRAAAAAGAHGVWHAGDEFSVISNRVAVGGRLVSVRAPHDRYHELFVPLHGSHQVDNVACALAAAEAFFDRALDERIVESALAGLTSPGRLEVVGRHPVVILDGSKNVAGAAAARACLDEEFPGAQPRVLVVGMLRGQGKDPGEVLDALGAREAALVVACPAPSPRTVPASEIAVAAAACGADYEIAPDVATAIDIARAAAGAEGLVLVAGSLYVVGAARDACLGSG